MSFSFKADRGLIIVRAELQGPSKRIVLRLALDTGATATLISIGLLKAAGYDPLSAAERTQVTTGSGVEYAPRVFVSRITALGQGRTDFRVLAHTLPPSASIDGLLGLDFMRNQVLTVDFRQGSVALR